MDGNFASTIADAVADAAKQMGHVNILIAGRSGVGKSTLVNAIRRVPRNLLLGR